MDHESSITTRCFIAIELPEELRSAIGQSIEELKAIESDVKWVRPENIHITMKFIGSTEDEKIQLISEALDRAASLMSPVRINVKGAGAFPSLRRPSVLWMGLDYPKMLVQLHAQIERELSALGYEADTREFKPHLTIGRIRRNRGRGTRLPRELGEKMKEIMPKHIGHFTAHEIALIKSDLKPSGPVYTVISKASL